MKSQFASHTFGNPGASRGRILLVGSGPHRAVLEQHDDELIRVTNVKAPQAGNDTGFLALIRGAVEDSEGTMVE